MNSLLYWNNEYSPFYRKETERFTTRDMASRDARVELKVGCRRERRQPWCCRSMY